MSRRRIRLSWAGLYKFQNSSFRSSGVLTLRTFSASSLEEYLKKAFLRSTVVSLTEEDVPTSFRRKSIKESFFFK